MSGQSRSVAWSPDGTHLATTSNNLVLIWLVDDTDNTITVELQGIFVGHGGIVDSVRWSPDGTKLATADWGSIYVWNVENNTKIFSRAVYAISMAWRPDSTSIATSSTTIEIWNAATGDNVTELSYPAKYQSQNVPSVGAIAWSPDGTQLLSVKPEPFIWNVFNSEVPRPFACCEIGTYALAWSPDGDQFASHEGTFDATTAVPLVSYDLQAEIYWSPYGSLLAGIFLDRLSIIDPISGASITTTASSGKPLGDLSWHPDGHQLATVDLDGTVVIWEIQ